MTTHEVRFQGHLIEHFTEEQAHAYVARRLAHPIEGPAFDPAHWTVAPRRPFELFSRGNLADTFDTMADAESARDEAIGSLRVRLLSRGRIPVDVSHFFTIEDKSAQKEPYATPTLTELSPDDPRAQETALDSPPVASQS